MKNSRGSVAVWVIIILVLVIIVGGAYWYLSQNSIQPATSATSVTQTSQQNTPLVTIDPNFLTITSSHDSMAGSGNFVRGTASTSITVEVSLTGGGKTYNLGEQSVSNSGYGSVWSADIPATIPSGTYLLTVVGNPFKYEKTVPGTTTATVVIK